MNVYDILAKLPNEWQIKIIGETIRRSTEEDAAIEFGVVMERVMRVMYRDEELMPYVVGGS